MTAFGWSAFSRDSVRNRARVRQCSPLGGGMVVILCGIPPHVPHGRRNELSCPLQRTLLSPVAVAQCPRLRAIFTVAPLLLNSGAEEPEGQLVSMDVCRQSAVMVWCPKERGLCLLLSPPCFLQETLTFPVQLAVFSEKRRVMGKHCCELLPCDEVTGGQDFGRFFSHL